MPGIDATGIGTTNRMIDQRTRVLSIVRNEVVARGSRVGTGSGSGFRRVQVGRTS